MCPPGSSKATPLPFLRGILGLPSDDFWACWATFGVHFVRSVALWCLARGHVRPTGLDLECLWTHLGRLSCCACPVVNGMSQYLAKKVAKGRALVCSELVDSSVTHSNPTPPGPFNAKSLRLRCVCILQNCLPHSTKKASHFSWTRGLPPAPSMLCRGVCSTKKDIDGLAAFLSLLQCCLCWVWR